MYRLSPYTYLVEGLLGQAIGRETITCADVELVQVNPPAGQTCAGFLDPFIAAAGGYITNPDATSACNYCSFRSTDEFLSSSFNIEWGHRWRNVGFLFVFIAFNVSRSLLAGVGGRADLVCRLRRRMCSRTSSASRRATPSATSRRASAATARRLLFTNLSVTKSLVV